VIGYHFTGDKLRNGEPIPPIGEWIEYKGRIVPCKSGLHMSEHPFDALHSAPGCLLHQVELEGDIVPHGDPVNDHVGRRRKIIATIDATDLLRAFARWCALQVIDLWNAPAIVREYLETGDETKRDAARTAAWAVASDTTMATTSGAALAAVIASSALVAVIASSAWDAASDAARDASDASGAASGAVWTSVWAAARALEWDAASDASDATLAAQRSRFAAMVEEAFRAAAAAGGTD